MKQILLLFTFTLLTSMSFAQQGGPFASSCWGCSDSGNDSYTKNEISYDAYNLTPTKSIQVYPNPAVSYIGVSNDEGVKSIVIYNLVGRKLKSFQAVKGEKYPVADLTDGMYLIQLVDYQNKVISTQRVSKRSTP